MDDNDRVHSARATGILFSVSVNTDFTKIMILDYADSAMEDLVTMSQKEFNPFDTQPSDHRMLCRRFCNYLYLLIEDRLIGEPIHIVF